ncbi:MAG TPA: GGDEF domain-containing protein [Thermoanaerobaculia bacterium]|jgi:diguanylate cyclase (GGDEF)-like protein
MSTVEVATARIIAPLSALLQKPLALVDGQSPEASQSFAIRFSVPRLCIVAADGQPFADNERRLLNEIFEVVRIAQENEDKYRELEERMISLQRENLDLTVRNRVLNEVSSRDTLTGLYNRWYVIEKIDSEINRALRHGSPMALLMLDIDHFKSVNDTYGHTVGDQVLQLVGKTLKDSCRVYDVPGRYGGEEFCVVLPETRVANTGVVAERIRQRLSTTPMIVGDEALSVTASFGIAGIDCTPEEGILSPAALIDRADRALYSAKHNGRNRVELWEGVVGRADEGVNH